tara:strand:+ start:1069 stop:1908 length:840 start_codon:yes stop_codon:yes gene_type:complete
MSEKRTASLAALDIGRDKRASDMIQQIEPVRNRDDVVLSAENLKLFTGLVEEFRSGDTLRRHGMPLRSKLLFCGPPGCGKTLTAEVFANELGLDLFVVRLDSIISSFLGETASNLRTVIEAAERRPCVLFFDEFDALARARTDSGEHNELKRVVNSLLMLIEGFKGNGFLIAATNLEDTLDAALWRRFDDVVLFERPTTARISQMLALKTRNFQAAFNIRDRAANLAGFSYAEIERVCNAAIKSAILSRRKKISAADFDGALKDEQRRRRIQKRVAASD